MKHLTDYLAAHGVPSLESVAARIEIEVDNIPRDVGSADDRAAIATDHERILAAMAEQASDELGWAWEVTDFQMIARRGAFTVAGGRDFRCAASAYLITNQEKITSTTILALLHGRNLMMKGGTNG